MPAGANVLDMGSAGAVVRAEQLADEARAVLAEIDANRAQLATVRAEAWLALARTALLLADTPLAADAVKRLRSDTELNLATDAWLDSRVAQVEGELLRAQGDLARSRDLLAQRVALLATSPDRAVPVIWQARLVLACTLVLLRDPGAPAALQQAARARPPQMPPGRPLDAVQAWGCRPCGKTSVARAPARCKRHASRWSAPMGARQAERRRCRRGWAGSSRPLRLSLLVRCDELNSPPQRRRERRGSQRRAIEFLCATLRSRRLRGA